MRKKAKYVIEVYRPLYTVQTDLYQIHRKDENFTPDRLSPDAVEIIDVPGEYYTKAEALAAYLRDITRVAREEIRMLRLPHSEVCMHLGVAGKVMMGRKRGSAVQLLHPDGSPLSFPITANEAGWDVQHYVDHELPEVADV